MKRTRKRFDPSFKTKVALEAIKGEKPLFHPAEIIIIPQSDFNRFTRVS